MFPYHHGRNLFNQTKANTMAIWRGEELPEQNEKDKLYGHCIIFLETMTESLMQLCLSTLVLREFGLSPNHSQASNQISGLFSSLISIILVFAKVRIKQLLFLFFQGFLCPQEIDCMNTLKSIIIKVQVDMIFTMKRN